MKLAGLDMLPESTSASVLLALSLAFSTLQTAHCRQRANYWVYFTDKGPSAGKAAPTVTPASRQLSAILSPRSLARRQKVLPAGSLVDAGDIPLYQPYVDAVTAAGGIPRVKSRWMNAASYSLDPSTVTSVSSLPFVRTVAPVKAFRVRPDASGTPKTQVQERRTSSLDYGQSLAQMRLINAIPLHEIGITGSGVLVGLLDSGFRWRTHESLTTRKVLAEHDFIHDRDVTANGPDDATNQDFHGTLVMSILGGYMPGRLIGPAFNAEFLLAKTEYVPVDIAVEEDYWAAGIEWMEAYGADVVSSSVGYDRFDDGTGYSWPDGEYNGRTSVTARAAIRAARLGVVVCQAMGNEGNGDGVTGTMVTPADADSIISVGAATYDRHLADFSSTGPTNDGRIKPDLVAIGMGVYGAWTLKPTAYTSQSGTSVATPLAAGAAALMLSARPELTPVQVRNALRAAADTIDESAYPVRPDNFIGWGAVNAFNAALAFGPVFGNQPAVRTDGALTTVTITVVSKFGVRPDAVTLNIRSASDDPAGWAPVAMSLDSSMIFPTSGRYRAVLPLASPGTAVRFFIDASDSAGNSYGSPAPVTQSMWQLVYGQTGVQTKTGIPGTYALMQNYPNPFNSSTTIVFETSEPVESSVAVYNVLGERVATAYRGSSLAGRTPVFWDGRTGEGLTLPSGVYFYRLTTPAGRITKKMVLSR